MGRPTASLRLAAPLPWARGGTAIVATTLCTRGAAGRWWAGRDNAGFRSVTAVDDLAGSAELWAGVAGGMVAVGLVIATGGRLRLALVLAAAIGLAALPVAAAPVFWVAVMVAAALVVSERPECTVAVVASGMAAAAAYVCVPDTELALVVGGAVGVSGVAAIVLGWSWLGAGTVVSVALVWIAVTDGSPRASAVIGTLAVAAIHALLQLGLPIRARPWPLLVIGSGAMFVSARVAGLGDGLLRPLAIAAAAVMVVAVLVLRGPSSPPTDP